ncbi:hypothetical protein IL306_003250, partial [Fusarium sp. DS 682]
AIDEPEILLGEIEELEDYVPGDAAEESNDNGIEGFAGTEFVDELYSDGGDSNKHGVRSALAAQVTDKNDFQIDHSKGSFRIKHYGRKASGSRAANPKDKYFPTFHLDIIGIVGRPLRPITSRSGFFDNVTFTLRYWHASYAGKHVTTNLPFDVRNRTFRIATAASREVWFIVMHPLQSQMDDLSGSHG